MIQTPKFIVWPYINMLSRRKFWLVVPLVLSVLAGLLFLKLSPKSYKATTLILLEPQSIPDAFVRSTVVETIEGRLRTITQQIQSRTNLEKIVEDFQINRRPSSIISNISELITQYVSRRVKSESDSASRNRNNDQLSMMKLVEELRENLSVSVRSGGGIPGGGGRLAFEITFTWDDPEIVAPVTNTLAARFIEQNLNAREVIAMNTTDFLDEETEAIRIELETREKQIEAFKTEHMGMLPNQLESNLSILNQLRERLLSVERRLEIEKQQAVILKSQEDAVRAEREAIGSVATLERVRAGGARQGIQTTNDQLTAGSLEDLEAELKRLNTLYTDKHPDVIAMQRRVEALKKEGRLATGRSGVIAPSSHQDRTSVQLATTNANIVSYKKEMEDLERQIQVYKNRVERTPQVEMELNNIMRDQLTVRQRYESLLSKKLDAKLAEQMEKRKKGEQFKILDPAVKPPKPVKPVPLRVMLTALVLGLGLGSGLAFAREMLDARFYSPEEVESYLDMNVLVSLPHLNNDTDS